MRFRILVGHTHLTSKLGSDKFLCASWALIDCASIIFDLNCKNKHNFPSIYESSTASLMSIFFLILKETLPESWLVWSPRSIIFKFSPWFMSIFRFTMSWKKRVNEVLNRSLSRGLGTPVVKIASFRVTVFTGK